MTRRSKRQTWGDDAIIARFESEAEEMLTQRRLVRDGLSSRLTMSFRDGVMTVEATGHDEDDVRSYVAALRRFLIEGEIINVQTVHDRVRRHIADDHIVSAMDDANHLFNRRDWVLPFTLTVTNAEGAVLGTFSAYEMFDAYLYGKVAHVDEEKARILDLIVATPNPQVRFVIVDCIVRITDYVGMMLSTIRYAKKNGLWSDDPVR